MQPKYKDKRTERFAEGKRVKEFQSFERQAYKRLEILEAAGSKEALMLLPSNRFEALGGDRQGQYSIRINDKWRICFEWSEEKKYPFNIEIVDYH
jgi:toxin HigB-1